MKGLLAYQLHNSLNLHFKEGSKYDCFKYNFKTKLNEESLKKNKYKWQYVGVESKFDNTLFLMYTVFERNDFCWVTPQMIFKEVHQLSVKRFDSNPTTFLNTTFKSDLLFLSKRYNRGVGLFGDEGLYPLLYVHYNKGEIDIKTLLLIDLHVKSVINRTASKDILVWPKFVDRIEKIKPFMEHFFNVREVNRIFGEAYLEQSV